jgi:hypothetical protein
MSLKIYPNFSWINKSMKNGDIFPDEIDINSIKINDPNITFQILPLEEKCIVSKGENNYEGILLNQNKDNVIIKSNNIHFNIRKYDSITTTPKQYNILFPDRINITNIDVSYIIKESGWNAIYNFDLDSNILDLNANVLFPLDYIGNIIFIAGDIKTNSSNQYKSIRSATMTSYEIMNNDDSSMEDVSEYKSINIGKGFLKKGNNILPIYKLTNMIPELIYRNNIQDNDVYFTYLLDNISQFLPSGIVTLYKDKIIIGKTNIKETQKNKHVELKLGKTSRIIIKNEVTKKTEDTHDTLISNETDISFKSIIDNTTDAETKLTLEYYIEKAEVSKVSCENYFIEENKLCFNLLIPIGKSNFNCSFHLHS